MSLYDSSCDSFATSLLSYAYFFRCWLLIFNYAFATFSYFFYWLEFGWCNWGYILRHLSNVFLQFADSLKMTWGLWKTLRCLNRARFFFRGSCLAKVFSYDHLGALNYNLTFCSGQMRYFTFHKFLFGSSVVSSTFNQVNLLLWKFNHW